MPLVLLTPIFLSFIHLYTLLYCISSYIALSIEYWGVAYVSSNVPVR